MGIFSKLFNPITTDSSNNIKTIYNKGVDALAKGDINQAIKLFTSIENHHLSAAYNLGLIYLDGAGEIIPDYNKARLYLKKAKDMGHQKAEKSAFVIGFDRETIIHADEYIEKFQYAISQFALGNQLGNLAYLVANDIIYNVIETSTYKDYSTSRFIDYEVYCIRNYANQEVNDFYIESSLTNWYLQYEEDWSCGETAKISDYLNEKVTTNIMRGVAAFGRNLQLQELGVLRLIVVDMVHKHFYE